jgi:hypothetical protein
MPVVRPERVSPSSFVRPARAAEQADFPAKAGISKAAGSGLGPFVCPASNLALTQPRFQPGLQTISWKRKS